MSQPVKKVNDLKQLLLLVAQDEEGLREHIYSKLSVGDMWWIPDTVTGFGHGEKHPWVVVVSYKPNHPPVMACPRTTKIGKRIDELYTPAKILPDLEKAGSILLGHRRQFAAEKFREFAYIGRLSDEWIRKIRDGVKRQMGSIR